MMRLLIYALLLCSVSSLFSCPTCVGRVSRSNPAPFFSDACYEADAQNSAQSKPMPSADKTPEKTEKAS